MKAMDAVDGAHASSTPPPPRVVATPAALELVALLPATHGPELMFHQSGGCCDNSAANCYLPGEITMGAGAWLRIMRGCMASLRRGRWRPLPPHCGPASPEQAVYRTGSES